MSTVMDLVKKVLGLAVSPFYDGGSTGSPTTSDVKDAFTTWASGGTTAVASSFWADYWYIPVLIGIATIFLVIFIKKKMKQRRR